jgi:hypothetical protein
MKTTLRSVELFKLVNFHHADGFVWLLLALRQKAPTQKLAVLVSSYTSVLVSAASSNAL